MAEIEEEWVGGQIGMILKNDFVMMLCGSGAAASAVVIINHHHPVCCCCCWLGFCYNYCCLV